MEPRLRRSEEAGRNLKIARRQHEYFRVKLAEKAKQLRKKGKHCWSTTTSTKVTKSLTKFTQRKKGDC